MKTVDIVLPVLNEENVIYNNMLVISRHLDRLPPPWRVNLIIADNGSTDATAKISENLVKSGICNYIRINQPGVGKALKLAWLHSSADIVGYMDIDIATNLNHVIEALEALNNGSHVVYGTRWHYKSVVSGRSLKRSMLSYSFNKILRYYLGAQFSDGMCGFKFLKRSILDELILNGAQSDGWFFATEVLYVAQKLGFDLHELPVRWTDDSDSRVKIIKLSIEYLVSMRRLRHKFNRQLIK